MKDSHIQGFYEDYQKFNPTLCVTVHPNTYIKQQKDDGTYEWGTWPSDEPRLEPITVASDPDTTKGCDGIDWGKEYVKKPLFRSIFYEDFHADVVNEWSTFDGGNAIEGIFRNVRTYAPFLKNISTGVKDGLASLKDDKLGGTVANFINNASQYMGNFASNVADFFQNALKVQGTKYAYYDGSDVNFSTLNLKTTLISGYVYNGEVVNSESSDAKNYNIAWKSVLDQIKDLSPYIIGRWIPFKKTHVTDKDSGVVAKVGEYVEKSGLLGWQTPPAGYQMEKRQVGLVNKGSFRLIFGGMYTIENLVVKSASVTYSRALCKNPENPLEVSPLYADVNIQFQPSGNFSSNNWSNFISYQGMADSQYMTGTMVEKQLAEAKHKEEVDSIKLQAEEERAAEEAREEEAQKRAEEEEAYRQGLEQTKQEAIDNAEIYQSKMNEHNYAKQTGYDFLQRVANGEGDK